MEGAERERGGRGRGRGLEVMCAEALLFLLRSFPLSRRRGPLFPGKSILFQRP